MVKHIVMWKLYDSAEGFTKAENARRMKQELEKLKAGIPAIQYLEAGINVNDSEDAFDVVLYAEFESREALATYQRHPEHVRFKEFIDGIRSEKRVVDYEV